MTNETLEMVERVAITLYRRDQQKHLELSEATRKVVLANPSLRSTDNDLGEHIWTDLLIPNWETTDFRYKEGWREEARATISAMREPTEAMTEKAGDLDNGYATAVTSGLAKDIWQTMIDVALGDTGSRR